MEREQILKEIKNKCEEEYSKIDNWIHNINHVNRVVKNGRKLSKLEKLKPKDAFLVEVACLLHDLGRVGEKMGLIFGKSDHAERSYLMSKRILVSYSRFFGRESTYKILEAVREHSQAELKHKNNLIAKILQDADRGAGINITGVYGMLVGSGLADFKEITTKEEARENLDKLTEELRNRGNIQKAINRLSIFIDWYYGTLYQKETGSKVDLLHTESARKLYKKDVEELKKYIEKLETRN